MKTRRQTQADKLPLPSLSSITRQTTTPVSANVISGNLASHSVTVQTTTMQSVPCNKATYIMAAIFVICLYAAAKKPLYYPTINKTAELEPVTQLQSNSAETATVLQLSDTRIAKVPEKSIITVPPSYIEELLAACNPCDSNDIKKGKLPKACKPCYTKVSSLEKQCNKKKITLGCNTVHAQWQKMNGQKVNVGKIRH